MRGTSRWAHGGQRYGHLASHHLLLLHHLHHLLGSTSRLGLLLLSRDHHTLLHLGRPGWCLTDHTGLLSRAHCSWLTHSSIVHLLLAFHPWHPLCYDLLALPWWSLGPYQPWLSLAH